MSSPIVTIVVPVYNGEKYIRDTLVSILEQSYKHIECIVVDDGSTDRTADICKEFSGRLSFFSKKNGGQADALNFGWSKAGGDYLSYLSADDLLSFNAIEALICDAVKVCADVVVYPKYELIDCDGVKIKDFKPLFTSKVDMVERFYCPVGPGAIFSRGLFELSGGWRSDLRQIPDFEFWLRLTNRAEFICHDEVLSAFRVHVGSITYAVSDFKKAEESILVAASLKKGGRLEGFNYNRFFASAYIFSACLHLRSGRVFIGLCRLLRAVGFSLRVTLSIYSLKRIVSSCTSVFRYRR